MRNKRFLTPILKRKAIFTAVIPDVLNWEYASPGRHSRQLVSGIHLVFFSDGSPLTPCGDDERGVREWRKERNWIATSYCTGLPNLVLRHLDEFTDFILSKKQSAVFAQISFLYLRGEVY
jgi:hypothetical protein